MLQNSKYKGKLRNLLMTSLHVSKIPYVEIQNYKHFNCELIHQVVE